eukprot:TRINITY_DN5942_c1_g3_i1.p1 TRINITY_DN5942_c1_g3~~TRINITY_DN5942_c1_g3_i1.p1  ORF type:complete len:290 (-),score=92.45 TRINITY_DN5942_c1_g3_i1:162-1031(-)
MGVSKLLALLAAPSLAVGASVSNCGGAKDHLSNVAITLSPDPISKTQPVTLTLTGTLDEDHNGGEVDIDLQVKALGVIDKALSGKTSYSLAPGVVKGPVKIVVGPVTLPNDPGEVVLNGKVQVKNAKAEPVACIALDVKVPLMDKVSEVPALKADEAPVALPTSCAKPTDHLKNIQVSTSGQATTTTGTLDEDLNSVNVDLDLTVKALFAKLPVKMTVPISFSPKIPKGDIKIVTQPTSSADKVDELNAAVGSISGTVVVNDGQGQEVTCGAVDSPLGEASKTDASIVV